MLEELPESLDETYERVLRGINKANRAHAHRLLQCLTVAIHPLRVAELAEVLAVDFGTASKPGTSKLKTDWRWEDQERAVLSTCSSLIAVVNDNGSQVVQFSHFSVKEFLTSPRLVASSPDVSNFHILLEPAHTIMARACLGTLLRLDDISDEDDVEERFPFALYAAEHWVTHAHFEDVSSHIREGMELLFDPEKHFFSAWIRAYDIDVDPDDDITTLYYLSHTHKSVAAPLYYSALCGFHDFSERLLNKYPQQVNATGGYYTSPLVAALTMEHFNVAQLLYQRGADIDVRGYHGRTPLIGASWRGHLETLQWLLHRGADPNLSDEESGWAALHLAARDGNLIVARTLLQHNADPNIQNRDGEIPLHTASRRGRPNVSRLLLEHGAVVNARSKNGATPLHLASEDGRLEVARLLIEHGADRGAEDNEGRTPLQVAQRSDMAELLSDYGPK
jgi:ankyrin repeat protein